MFPDNPMTKLGVFREKGGFAAPAYVSHCSNKFIFSYIQFRRIKFPYCSMYSSLKFSSGDSDHPTHSSSFVASASSSPSVSGSGAEYSGNFNSSSIPWLHQISVIYV